MKIFLKIILLLMFLPFVIIYYIFKILFNDANSKNAKRNTKTNSDTSNKQFAVIDNVVPKDVYVNAYNERKSKSIPSDYIVFDTETTGLEPEIDRIIELSAIKYINHEKVDEFSYLINPKMHIDPFITQLTGISNKDLENKPYINDVLNHFFDWIGDYTLIAHNVPYDIKMIACECYRSRITMCDNKVIDTVTLAKRIFPKEEVGNYKLETLKNYLGLAYGSHRALDDCEVCSAVYQVYCDRHN